MTISFRSFASAFVLATSIFALRAQAVEITLACGAVGLEYELCKKGSDEWSKKTGHKVKLASTPSDTNQKLALLQQLLSAKSPDIDVFKIDIVWPGVLHSHFEDLKPYIPASEAAEHFTNLIQNNTIQNRLVALPWYVDMGVLYYRKDLLQKYNLNPPKTWEELVAAAKTVQAGEKKRDSKFVGFVFQGKAYEGLTCNALEWVASYGGGTLVDEKGIPNVNNPQAKAALRMAASWIDSITPKGVLNYAEEEARGVFQSGGALFMRNWPYAWALLNSKDSAVAGKVGVAPIPSGGNSGLHTPVLGGWQLAVSRYSKHKKEAADLVLFLTSKAQQQARMEFGFNPTRPALYKDAALAKKYPFIAELGKALHTAVARPSRNTGNHYNRVSNEFWNSVYSAISGRSPADKNLDELQKKLQRLSKNGKWN